MKPFRDTLAKLRQGKLDEELAAALAAVVNGVQATNKAGSVTLIIKIKPTKSLAVEIEDVVKADVPQLSQPSTLLFPTVEGNLQEQNPMQKSLDLTIVADGGVKQLNTVSQDGHGGGPLAQAPGAAASS